MLRCFIRATLTKFHEQGQEDPQRDLKGRPNMFIVEGEDGESLFMSRGVCLAVGILLYRSG